MSTSTDSPSTPSSAPTSQPEILPLGYIRVNGIIQPDPRWAERIRQIFRQYVKR